MGRIKNKIFDITELTISKFLVGLVIIAFFAFGDYSIYVYSIKVLAIIGLVFASKHIRIDGYIHWIFAFSIWCCLSFVWASDKDIVISYLIWYLQAILLASAIGFNIKDTDDIEFILKCMMIGAVILSIRALKDVPFANLGSFRLGKNIGYNSNELALKASIGSIIAFRYFRETTNHKIRVLYIISAFIPMVAVVFSGSRKGILMTFVSIFLFTILCSSNPGKLLKNSFLALSGLIVVYLLMTKVTFLYDSFGRRFLLLLNVFKEDEYVGNSIGNRLNDISLGLDAFSRSPLWGYGLGNYMVATGLSGYAHNNYVQVLVDLGLIGLLIYYSFYIRNAVGLIKTIRINRSLNALLLSMIIVIIVIEVGLVSFNSDYVQIIIMLGYYTIVSNRNKEDQLSSQSVSTKNGLEMRK